MSSSINKRHNSSSSRRSDDPRNHQESMSDQKHNISISISSTSTKYPISWKLYDNPFFSTTSTPISNSGNFHFHFRRQLQRKYTAIHPRPDLSKKLISSSSTAFSMDASPQNQQIAELKAELDLERRVRKKMEALNKRVARELAEERREKQGLQRSCDKLRGEMWRVKGEMQRIMRKHMEDEKKMLRMANLLREERHKLHIELADVQPQPIDYNRNRNPIDYNRNRIRIPRPSSSSSSSCSKKICVGELESKRSASITANVKYVGSSNCNPRDPSSMSMRKPQPENPHIKRGIKGLVEFPNHVVKLKAMAINGSTHPTGTSSASGARNRDIHMGTKLECLCHNYKSQLRIQALPSNPLIIT